MEKFKIPKSLFGILQYLCLAIVLLTLFFTSKFHCIKSRPFFGIAAVLCPILATASGFGILLIFQQKPTAINYVCPFLLLSIGVNHGFLFLNSWQRTCKSLTVRERLEFSALEAIPSVFFSSFTDFLSFAIGIFPGIFSGISGIFSGSSNSKGIREFSIFMTISSFFLIFYQITFLLSAFVFDSWREAKNFNSFFLFPKKKEKKIPKIFFEKKKEKKKKIQKFLEKFFEKFFFQNFFDF